jgi:hypothetical protein
MTYLAEYKILIDIAQTAATVLILAGAFWVRASFAAKADFIKLGNSLTNLLAESDKRIALLEQRSNAYPSARDLHSQIDSLSKVQSELENKLGAALEKLGITNMLITDLLKTLASQQIKQISNNQNSRKK